jgi:hypothetical protein
MKDGFTKECFDGDKSGQEDQHFKLKMMMIIIIHIERFNMILLHVY